MTHAQLIDRGCIYSHTGITGHEVPGYYYDQTYLGDNAELASLAFSRMPKSDEQKGEDFASLFGDFCNTYNRKPQKIAVAKMLKDHRTNQQNMMRFCMMFIEEMAKQDSDGRNEASVELAKEIMNLDSRKLALPYV